jgi:WD40 repeat protein
MLRNYINIFKTLCVAIIIFSCSNEESQNYFGQTPPGNEPEIFAPGIISTAEHEYSNPCFSSNGKEVFWTVRISTLQFEFPTMILTMKKEINKWSMPRIAEFSGVFSDTQGCFSPDGKKFFFGSDRPIETNGKKISDLDLWYVEKNNSHWSKPVRLNSLINTDKLEMQPTIAANGNLYYVGHFEEGQNNFGIYRSKYQNGEYLKPELLGSNINSKEFQWTPYIAPDESYLLFSGIRSGGYGVGDIYISLRTDDGSFGKPINLGPKINTKYNERFPYISLDKKYLFFGSTKSEYSHNINNPYDYNQIKKISNKPGNGWCDIYWVDAKIIENSKPENMKD